MPFDLTKDQTFKDMFCTEIPLTSSRAFLLYHHPSRILGLKEIWLLLCHLAAPSRLILLLL